MIKAFDGTSPRGALTGTILAKCLPEEANTLEKSTVYSCSFSLKLARYTLSILYDRFFWFLVSVCRRQPVANRRARPCTGFGIRTT